MKPQLLAAARALAITAAALMFPLPLSGCMYQDYKRQQKEREERLAQEEEEEKAVAPLRRGLDVGETVVFKFPIDNMWHPAPYSAYRNHLMEIKTHGESQMLGNTVVLFRIGTRQLAISDETDFLVTNPGALAFRVDPVKAGAYKGDCEVEITRVK